MEIEKYPLGLRTILRAGKSRQMVPTYRLSNPRSGPGYVQALSEDAPVIWDVTFRFQRNDRLIFIDWFKRKINSGKSPFLMKVNTEYGLLEYEMKFLPDGLLPVNEDGNETYTYRASMFARKLEPDWADAIGEFIDIAPDWFGEPGISIFDVAMNQEWPAV